MPKVSFLIPAKNEEKHIVRIIHDIRKQVLPPDFEREIIICSNGSSDRTAELAGRHPEVKVIQLPNSGKVNAMNVLSKAATGTHLVFLDADVIPDTKSSLNLLAALNDRNIILAGGTQRLLSQNKFQEKIRRAYEITGSAYFGVRGGMFAVRKEDFPSLPQHLINEDNYLSLKVGSNRIEHPPEAIFYHFPPDSFISLFRRSKRLRQGEIQLNRAGFVVSQLFKKHFSRKYSKVPLKIIAKGIPILITRRLGRFAARFSKIPKIKEV